jgi:hypothetical protein
MPKKPHRDNRQFRETRSVQSAADLLRRISRKGGLPGLSPPVSGTTKSTPDATLVSLRQKLGDPLGSHLVEVLSKPDELVLFVDSAAWAGRLKLALPALTSITGERRVTVRLMGRRV